MNTLEVLENDHLAVIKSVENLSEIEWDLPGVCGDWSVKEVLAHLAAYELLLIDILETMLGDQASPTPYMLRFASSEKEAFNRDTIRTRRYRTAQQIEDEYEDAQAQSTSLLARVPSELLQQKRALSWYKPDINLEQWLDTFHQHIQKHCEQIARFRAQAK
jgi:hypothetical protein